jgi:ribose/xylose/arabinose/galactoside ABC-type transport system permease subunit
MGLKTPTLRTRPRLSKAEALGWAQHNGVFFALVFLVIFFAVGSDHFLTASNINEILLQTAITGIIAVPGAMLVLAGYVDLSVGSVMTLTAVVFGKMFTAGAPIWAAVVVALAVAMAWGLMNAVLIAHLDFSPIVVTLGGLAGAEGLAQVISQGQTVSGFGQGFDNLGNGTWLGHPIPVYIFVAVVLIGAYLWYQMPYGRYLTAIGSNADAARTLGVPVRSLPFATYVASGLAAGIGGLIFTAQLDGASLSIGQNEELAVLTAILVGGVSFLGGRGSLFGVVCGLLFLTALENGLIVLNVGVFYQDVALGAALVAAAGADVLYRRLERVSLVDRSDE